MKLDDISSKMKEHGRQLAERELSSEIALTLLWINSSQYDGFSHVKKIDSWTHLKSKWNFIFVWSYRQICWSLRSIQLSIQHKNREVCRLRSWTGNISTDCRLLYKVILRSGIPRRVFEHYWHSISVGCRPSLLPIDRMLSSVNL